MQMKFPVAKLGEIQLGSAKSFRMGIKNGIAFNDGGQIRAYENFCTHMGGPVDISRDGCQFVCRWHGACFDAKTGERQSGQAPEQSRLKPVKLVEEHGTLFAVVEFSDGF